MQAGSGRFYDFLSFKRRPYDDNGHGTHVAGIAAGNGNGNDNEQNTKYRGVAYESTLIIVKLKTSGGASFPTTTQIMLAVDFCIRKSIDMNMPIAINLSFGTSNGSHSGTSLLETYLDYIAENYRCAVSVGSGNDGAALVMQTADHTLPMQSLR